jgi:cell division protein FtsB
VRRLFLLFSPGRIILALVLVAAGYLLLHAGGNVVESFRLADDEAHLKQQVDELHGQEQQLQQIRDYLRTDEYIEFMARRVFGLVKPGEKLVVVEAPDAPPSERDSRPGRPWWEALFGR